MTFKEKCRLIAKVNRAMYALRVAQSPHTINPATYLEQAQNILNNIKREV